MAKTFDEGKDGVAKLCQYFATNHQAFLAEGVKEAHVRQSLIDPFFEALGWDVRNTAMVAPQYREVVVEDSLDVEGHQKAPDYAFRVGISPKFYTEAKKCVVNINTDPGSAYQLRRYGWSAKVAVSLLTDFEELGVYDCTLRPRPSDKASHARILYFRFEEYADRWRELWGVFSREAVWSGAFDQYTASKRKRGTSEVDVEFLKEIEGWRESLAHNMALRNTDLSSPDLNAAVQRTIDRVVFLRMAEDRGLEPYGQLLKLCERPGIYCRFMDESCRRADEKYNSGLFHFEKQTGVTEAPDWITPKLKVDDKVFKPILESLYFENGCPYHFGVLPVEILGTVYERFLGKVIRLTAGHQAKVEEKPEVRKAGGVYYTPAYIVDYIVKQTVSRQIEGKSPAQLAGGKNKPPLRILDMACGSGSFLLGAYQCLLDHCLKWYIDHKPEANKKAVYQDPRNGQWRLTIEEKKRILITHIFGVDIDSQAVEVSKLSLLLKALEGENDASVVRQLELFGERALPNLADNIKRGNSLIGTDYFSGRLIFEPDEVRRVSAFDWNKEFSDAMKNGGFDCVIGNPPYIDSELMTKHYAEERAYCTSHYEAAAGNWDLFCVFIEKALWLCKSGGLHSFIVPNKLVSAEYATGVRSVIVRNHLLSLRDYSKVRVFPVAVYPVVYVVAKGPAGEGASVEVEYEVLGLRGERGMVVVAKKTLPLSKTFGTGGSPWLVGADSGTVGLLGRLSEGFPHLKSIASVCGAATVGEAYVLQPLIEDKEKPCKDDIRLVNSGTINRYVTLWGAEKCRYLGESFLHPVIAAEKFGGVPPKRLEQASRPKLIVAGMTKRLECFGDLTGGILAGKSTSLVFASLNLRYLLGILNSRLIDFYYKAVYSGNALQGGYLRIGPPQLKEIPIRCVELADPEEKALQDRMSNLVDSMMSLQEQLVAGKSEMEKEVLKRQIDATEAEIDQLVYELYGLTAKEIAMVEGE